MDIMEMQIKFSLRFHSTPDRIAILKINNLDMVVHSCNPRKLRGRERRFRVPEKSGLQSLNDPVSKQQW